MIVPHMDCDFHSLCATQPSTTRTEIILSTHSVLQLMFPRSCLSMAFKGGFVCILSNQLFLTAFIVVLGHVHAIGPCTVSCLCPGFMCSSIGTHSSQSFFQYLWYIYVFIARRSQSLVESTNTYLRYSSPHIEFTLQYFHDAGECC